jgi:hypothetical protein
LSEYAGRIAIGAVVAVALAVALAFELSYYVPGTASSSTTAVVPTGSLTTSTVTMTGTVGNELPPTGCSQASSVSTDGYRLNVFVTPSPVRPGGSVCFYTDFMNVANKSTAFPTGEEIVVTNSTGTVFFQNGCVILGNTGIFAQNGTGWQCNMTWNTGNGYNGIVAKPGIYSLIVRVVVSTTAVASYDIRIQVGGGTTTATTTSSCVITGEGGPVFAKVVTDQGAIINNGTIQVTHTGPSVNGAFCGTANYKVPLRPNATGWVQISASDGLPLAGSYNLTLVAGYGGSKTYTATITDIKVNPLTTVYVTISVPSGIVSIVDCILQESLYPLISSSATSMTSSSSTSSSSTSTSSASPCGSAARLTAVNGSNYCAIDVSNDIVVGAPGYSYFFNGSITYMGVNFQTICPSTYQGCPGSTSSSTQMMIGAIKFNMTFSGQTVETAGQAIGDSTHVLILSNHAAPRAGMQIEYGPSPYDAVPSTSNYHVFLLVQLPAGA